MKVELNISKYGDYGLLFVELLDALLHLNHAAIGTVCERMAQIARQKLLDESGGPEGVVR